MYKVFQLLFELATGVSFITIDNLVPLLSDVTLTKVQETLVLVAVIFATV
ncbi:hypothetical protein [Pedobacter sp. D749]|nr:hypothetical protein [Pedobacter sp. D749]QXU42363.1 hypothetical protein KYH19_01810 [Pedobacter sp. D749]